MMKEKNASFYSELPGEQEKPTQNFSMCFSHSGFCAKGEEYSQNGKRPPPGPAHTFSPGFRNRIYLLLESWSWNEADFYCRYRKTKGKNPVLSMQQPLEQRHYYFFPRFHLAENEIIEWHFLCRLFLPLLPHFPSLWPFMGCPLLPVCVKAKVKMTS